MIGVVSVSLSLSAFGSNSLPDTVAVSLIVISAVPGFAPAFTRTVRSSASVSASRVRSYVQVTAFATGSPHVQLVPEADCTVPFVAVSVTVTPVASSGPPLPTDT